MLAQGEVLLSSRNTYPIILMVLLSSEVLGGGIQHLGSALCHRMHCTKLPFLNSRHLLNILSSVGVHQRRQEMKNLARVMVVDRSIENHRLTFGFSSGGSKIEGVMGPPSTLETASRNRSRKKHTKYEQTVGHPLWVPHVLFLFWAFLMVPKTGRNTSHIISAP